LNPGGTIWFLSGRRVLEVVEGRDTQSALRLWETLPAQYLRHIVPTMKIRDGTSCEPLPLQNQLQALHRQTNSRLYGAQRQMQRLGNFAMRFAFDESQRYRFALRRR